LRAVPRLWMALLLVLAGCGESTPDTPPTSPVAAPSPGEERSVTGQVVHLPPPPPGGFDPPVTVTFEGAPPLRVEVARTAAQRARGLMQRRELAPGTGMLFVFPYRGDGGFYMLGTLIPLSIAYVDGDTVVGVRGMQPCPGQQCPTYAPGKEYTAAVEAEAGFFPANGVTPGTTVTIHGSVASPE
jgi:uncharacterized membrane protein (UPF0127 family)